ncbi:MAG: MFS transporter [Ottowia sp.]|uniref:MFS transporter n=1 Tax=Ottowia sp. TaxID=1898956 RepID=UPI0039E6CB9C
MPDASSPTSLRQHRAFMHLWRSRLLGGASSQMLMLAIGWRMYDLTGSAWDLGLVGLFQFAPALLLALPAGQVADQRHRGRVVSACQAVVTGVALVLLAAHAWRADSRALLLGVSLVLGAVRAYQMPAQQALTPLLVPPLLLPHAMAFSAAGVQAAVIGGPALGGALYAWDASVVYGACALLSGAAAAFMAAVRYAHQPPPRQPFSAETLLAGVRFIASRKPVLGAISLDLFAVLLGGAVALLPIFAKDILHTGAWGLGLLRGAPAVGALGMSLWLTRHPPARRIGRTLLAAVAVFGACMVAFGLSRSFWLSLAALAVSGAADMVSVVIRQTLVQLETPDAMRGRVSAVNSIFIGASNQLGEFESGALAAWLGPVGSAVLGGVGTMLVALGWVRLFPSLARRDRMDERRG